MSELPKLDIDRLPARLDKSTLSRLRELADAPLPPLPSCPEDHLLKCIRIMQATLPRRASDELGGKLMLAAYARKLGDNSQDAISYMTDKALELQWFPTIHDCLEILKTWERNDSWTRLKTEARRRVRAEIFDRQAEQQAKKPDLPPLTQEGVDAMLPEFQNLGIAAGWLRREGDRVVIVPEETAPGGNPATQE